MDCPIQQLLLLLYGLGSWNWWSRSTHPIDVFDRSLLIMNFNDRFCCYMWHVNINYLVYSFSLYFSVCRGLDNSFLVDFTWVEQTVDSVTTVVTSVTAECWNVDSVPTLSCLFTSQWQCYWKLQLWCLGSWGKMCEREEAGRLL